jgi:hypothetical protein
MKESLNKELPIKSKLDKYELENVQQSLANADINSKISSNKLLVNKEDYNKALQIIKKLGL